MDPNNSVIKRLLCTRKNAFRDCAFPGGLHISFFFHISFFLYLFICIFIIFIIYLSRNVRKRTFEQVRRAKIQ